MAIQIENSRLTQAMAMRWYEGLEGEDKKKGRNKVCCTGREW